MNVYALVLVALLALAAPATAQTIEGYRLSIYTTGAAQPMNSFDFAMSAVTCNLPVPSLPPAPATNPTRAIWDDPTNAGRICQWTDPGTGPLFSVPSGGSYEAALQAYNSEGRSGESNRSPFTRLAAPSAAPTGFRLIRP